MAFYEVEGTFRAVLELESKSQREAEEALKLCTRYGATLQYDVGDVLPWPPKSPKAAGYDGNA